MNTQARIFPNKMVKNIAMILSLIIITTIILPCTNIVSYGSQYRENTSIEDINETKYPGYKALLNAVKTEHPNWTFTLLYTGLDWNTVIHNETVNHGDNLVQAKDGEWVCSSNSCVNEDGTSKVYEGSNWYCASTKAVSYYMDPRNFLYSDKLFQFERLSYTDGIYTIEGIEKILAGTFMANTSPKAYYKNESYSGSTFAQIMLDAGISKQISPYHIASRIKQEIVLSGGGPSRSVTGTVSGFEGVYNFFNIGASTGAGAIEKGLEYASRKGWKSPELAIIGGAESIAKNYIAKGQDTLYLQKFNVDSQDGSLYNHQYQANIQAPQSESKKIHDSYKALGILDAGLNFIIPVYENMPQTVSPLPNNEYKVVTENVMVTDTNINIREAKSTSSTVIAKVNTGDVLLRIEKGITKVNDYIWDKVVLSDGQIGYISTQFVNLTNDVITCETQSYVSTSSIVRNGPGTEKTTAICQVQVGQKVIIIDKARYSANGYTWDKIKLEDGTIGYIPSQYLTNITASTEGDIVKVATSRLPLTMRSEPGTTKDILLKIEKGTLIIRLESNASTADGVQWAKVKTLDGTVGYVSEEYLELVVPQLVDKPDLNKFVIDEENKVINCEEEVTLEEIIKQKPTTTIKNKQGETISDATKMLATGNIAIIDGIEYKIVKLGDVSGDGVLDIIDLTLMKRHILNIRIIENEYLQAGNLDDSEILDIMDLTLLKRHILNIRYITI